MSLELELETPINAEAIEVREFVSVLAMTTNELISDLWDICNGDPNLSTSRHPTLVGQREDYKKMIVNELKLRMHSHTL